MAYTLTEETLSQLIADKLHRVTATAYKITKNWDDAEDAAQKACIKAFTYMHNFRGDSTPYSWFTSIAVNEAKQIIAKRSRRPPSEDVPYEVVDNCGDMSHNESPDAMQEMSELEQVVSLAVEAMLPEFRQALTMREDFGLTYDEISDNLGIPASTARTRVTRAKRYIKRALEELNDERS